MPCVGTPRVWSEEGDLRRALFTFRNASSPTAKDVTHVRAIFSRDQNGGIQFRTPGLGFLRWSDSAYQPEPVVVFATGHHLWRRRADQFCPARVARTYTDPCRTEQRWRRSSAWAEVGRGNTHACSQRNAPAYAHGRCG